MFAKSQDVAEKPFSPLPGAETAAGNARLSVLHEDITVIGTLTSDGILDLAGFFEGDLTVDTLVLAKTGRIKGNVRARNVTIEGSLQGTISAISVTLKTSAQVTADIVAQKLVIEAGAMIEGRVAAKSNQTQDQASASQVA